MANLYFPQLTSGALAQYPIRKVRQARTVKNVLGDGSMILFPDPDGAMLSWQLSYTDLSTNDIQALQTHFEACGGGFRAFTFIDPTDNMVVSSSDLTATAWQTSSLINVSASTDGFVLTNTGQTTQQIGQTLNVPASYQYCFSLYAMSMQASAITLIRSGPSAQASNSFAVGPNWARIVSSGTLNDSGNALTIAISLAAGQQIAVYGPQLEAQIAPSRYRPTAETGAVYSNAHWAVEQLTITAQAPNLFATSFGIETAL